MEKSKIISYAGRISVAILVVISIARKIWRDSFMDNPLVGYALRFLFPIAGLYAIVATHEQHDYFVESFQYKFFRKIFGVTGAKVVFYLLGLGLIVLGVFVEF